MPPTADRLALPMSPEFTALKRLFTQRFYFSDPDVVDVVLGVYAGNHLVNDPLWLYLISPPSAGKSELLFSLEKCQDAVFISDLTPNTLISGWKDEPRRSRRSRVPDPDPSVVTPEPGPSLQSPRAGDSGISISGATPHGPPEDTPTPGIGESGLEPGAPTDASTTAHGNTETVSAGTNKYDEPPPQDFSLLPHLDGKVLVTKDFTLIHSKPHEMRAQILSMLRDAYDGSMTRAFGNSPPKKFKARFNYLAGMTPEIEKTWSLNVLGDRFLMYRIHIKDRGAHARRALDNVLDGKAQDSGREDLQLAVQKFMQDLPKTTPKVGPWARKRLVDLGEILAVGRTYVQRSKNDELICQPQAELGSRVVKQLLRLAQSLALVRGRSAVTSDELRVVRRVVLDSMPSNRRKLLTTLWQERAEPQPMLLLTRGLDRLSNRTRQREIDNLLELGVVVRSQRQELVGTGKPAQQGGEKQAKIMRNYYQLAEEFRQYGENIGGIED